VHERILLAGTHTGHAMTRECVICQAECPDGFSQHMKINHPHACQVCKIDFEGSEARAKHNINEHGDQHVCQICFHTFRIADALAAHQVAKNHIITCKHCKNTPSFKNSQSFDQHVKAKHPHLIVQQRVTSGIVHPITSVDVASPYSSSSNAVEEDLNMVWM